MGKKKFRKKIILIAIVIIAVYVVGFSNINFLEDFYRDFKPVKENLAIKDRIINNNNSLTIINWNIQTFGVTKWNKTTVRNKIIEVVPKADIIFIQEIRDKNGESFESLCQNLSDNFNCNISSRAGRSSSKEQYGILYQKNISLVSLEDFNPDKDDRWERPPIKATFSYQNYSFSAYNVHIKPDDVKAELEFLERVVDNQGNVVLLGDFNADCSYFDTDDNELFSSWNWIITNSDDTTVAKSSCAYDRILLNQDMNEEFLSYGIYEDIAKETSDHYPVWVEISFLE
jgi:deoxyribonuclease-1-like protein